jgi:hypothetical protein
MTHKYTVITEAKPEAREAMWETESVVSTTEAAVEDSEEARNSGPTRM